MRTSIDHLLPGRRKLVEDITHIIIDEIQPEKIILFGSYARGNFVEHRYTDKDRILYEYISDCDFLAIVTQLEEREYILEEKLNSKTSNFRQPVNIIVHDKQFINESLSEGWFFFSDVVKEGILLYDSSNEPLTTARLLTDEETRIRRQSYFGQWIKRSVEFRIDARNAFDRGSLNNAIFYLHQSAESLYYTMLLVHTSYKPKTHHLYKLRNQTKRLSKELFLFFNLANSNEDIRLFELLKRGYIDARYNGNYAISKEDLAVLLEKVDAMEDIVTRSCQDLM
jgi:HEPN domain-containing protein/predicted nucleotidyltransferase